jgi:accessory gene regulator protein AgrB
MPSGIKIIFQNLAKLLIISDICFVAGELWSSKSLRYHAGNMASGW